MSAKWPVLCRVESKTLLSLNLSCHCAWRKGEAGCAQVICFPTQGDSCAAGKFNERDQPSAERSATDAFSPGSCRLVSVIICYIFCVSSLLAAYGSVEMGFGSVILWLLDILSSVPSVLFGHHEEQPACKKLSDEVLVWLSVWSKVQIVCIWSSWCHCFPNLIISCLI